MFAEIENAIKGLKGELGLSFILEDLGPSEQFLCIDKNWIPSNEVRLSQPRSFEKLLATHKTSTVKPVNNSTNATYDPDVDEESLFPEDKTNYRCTNGGFLYHAAQGRSDVTATARMFGTFMKNPRMKHTRATKRVLQYLRGTYNYAPRLTPGSIDQVTVYADAS